MPLMHIPGVSLAATLKHLNEEEERDQKVGTEAPTLIGMAGWVVDGIDLETVQYVKARSSRLEHSHTCSSGNV